MRCTAPMKASLPPPTMPSRMRAGFSSLIVSLPRLSPSPTRITRMPAATTSSSLSKSGRQTRVAAARSGSACPNASMVNQPS